MGIISNFRGQYAFLSNFYYSDFTIDGQTYRTVEHYYQSQKANDINDKLKIINTEKPGSAKRLGKEFNNDKPNWHEIKASIMEIGIRAKFNQNTELRNNLISTKDNQLEEGNHWHDNFWGNCQCLKCDISIGQNRLGQILMKIRDELKNIKIGNAMTQF